MRRLETTDAPRPETTALVWRPTITDKDPRCTRCKRKLAYMASRPWCLQCSGCRMVNTDADWERSNRETALTQSATDAHS